MSSSTYVNYSLRESKNIERKMIRDVLTRLGVFFPLEKYKYIGFGARYFSDFILFHRYLHISKMISLESDTNEKERYEFNKPFNCIDILYGLSNEVLPTINIDGNSIVWLDYDGILNKSCLIDVSNVASKADTGTVLLVSYNSCPQKLKHLKDTYPDKETHELYKTYLMEKLNGEEFIPFDTDFHGLSNWRNYSILLRNIVINCIEESLSRVNEGLENKILYKQILNFNYKDGVEMSTLGLVFYKKNDEVSISQCKFDSFDFCSFSNDPYEIEVPKLTIKEMKFLNENIPLHDNWKEGLVNKPITEGDIKKYAKIYKYMPNFSDVEIV